MNKRITYSFIIPHKNSPDFLARCLQSIPEREDIQIIVVDDNSDKVDWRSFTYNCYRPFELIKTTEGKGAGYARNIGLDHAKGQWLVFSDCDDFFVDGFLDILDSYKDTDAEVVYYGANGIDSDTYEPNSRIDEHNRYLQLAAGNSGYIDMVKYHLHSPWWKMVNREFVVKHDIRFEIVPNGNDILWSYQIAYLSTKVIVTDKIVYNYTFTKGSITTRKNFVPLYICRIQHKVQINRFFDYIGHSEWKTNIFRSLLAPLKREGFWMFMKTTMVLAVNAVKIFNERNKFINVITSRP